MPATVISERGSGGAEQDYLQMVLKWVTLNGMSTPLDIILTYSAGTTIRLGILQTARSTFTYRTGRSSC